MTEPGVQLQRECKIENGVEQLSIACNLSAWQKY